MSTPLQYIRTIYLSLAALIGLVVFVIGTVGIINLTLENFVFPIEDEYYPVYPKSGVCETYFNADTGEQDMLSESEQAECEEQQKENRRIQSKNSFNRQISNNIAMILVGLPIWLLHFFLLQADWRKLKKK
ncbi:hypothetical protein GF376_00975 [Candidatus Peregrinibacteria bacterium]|nr:hypothetical protein [Candidatus Peregrinibacteria bacterium]